ncbi:Protein N-acetyltransferase, RimJ/RimL family [Streptosporangium subroseum]|uniref:Protein N-acetyltransferase, RimJ/RimL family n=1 Tax=Streptosporangium subroseum TaxID=106412 RepID=A0A239BRP9_9ACTN|nr:Protein N-acetyltransferase, RimJ/RimL family [Streptosporangium subroseum]
MEATGNGRGGRSGVSAALSEGALAASGGAPAILPGVVRLSGHGVVLREWEDDDLVAMVGLFDDPDVAYWTPLASPFDLEAARVYLKRAQERRAAGKRVQLAVTVDGGEPMGEVLLMLSELDLDVAEIGYAMGAAYRGRGLAARAVRVMTGFAHDTVGVSRLLLEIEAGNAASAAVARAAGYRLTEAPPIHSEEKGRPISLQTWEYDHA